MTSNAPVETHRCVTAKVVLLGDGGTGKTTFVRRFANALVQDDGRYERTYRQQYTGICQSLLMLVNLDLTATIGVYVHSITLQTSVGQPLCFEVWDTSGQEQFGAGRDAFYRGARCGVLFFDVLARVTYKNCPLWYRDLKRVEPEVHVVLVGNKVDVARRQVQPKHISFHRKVGVPYIEMSAKGNYNVDKPFLHFARSLLNDMKVDLLEGTVMAEPEVEIDITRLREASERSSGHEEADDSDGSNEQSSQ